MNELELKNHFLLLQMNDSLFPIGGYSHSYGPVSYTHLDVYKRQELEICRKIQRIIQKVVVSIDMDIDEFVDDINL